MSTGPYSGIIQAALSQVASASEHYTTPTGSKYTTPTGSYATLPGSQMMTPNPFGTPPGTPPAFPFSFGGGGAAGAAASLVASISGTSDDEITVVGNPFKAPKPRFVPGSRSSSGSDRPLIRQQQMPRNVADAAGAARDLSLLRKEGNLTPTTEGRLTAIMSQSVPEPAFSRPGTGSFTSSFLNWTSVPPPSRTPPQIATPPGTPPHPIVAGSALRFARARTAGARRQLF